MSFTVIPLHNLNLPTTSPIVFGNEFVLQVMPEWVKKDNLLSHLSYGERQSALAAKYALVAEYEASSIGEPDPEYKGNKPRSIQESKSEAAMMANLALWLVQPSTTCITTIFHAIGWTIPGEPESLPVILQMENRTPLYVHPDDVERQVSIEHVRAAGNLFIVLRSIPRKNAVWTAIRSIWGALTMLFDDLRYPLFWIGLEALFGPENSGSEITYKLSQRIAFMISTSPESAKDTFRKARDCYSTRSKIVHGRWDDDPKMLPLMANTESIVRDVLLRLLSDTELLQKFISKDRDRFLEDMVFSRHALGVHRTHLI